MSKTILCPSCGGPTDVRTRSIQVLVCSYCSQTIVLSPDGPLAGDGKSAALADLFTDLSTGAAGTLGGRTFSVLGRVRYAWSQGYWDEWILLFEDGTEAWLHEDEGELSLLTQVPVTAAVPVAQARVGKTLPVMGQEVYVTEVRDATIHGAEGQLPRGVVLGGTLRYIDGKAGGRHYMLEVTGDTIELFTGDTLDDGAVEVHGS